MRSLIQSIAYELHLNFPVGCRDAFHATGAIDFALQLRDLVKEGSMSGDFPELISYDELA
jgi:hypothetical protein